MMGMEARSPAGEWMEPGAQGQALAPLQAGNLLVGPFQTLGRTRPWPLAAVAGLLQGQLRVPSQTWTTLLWMALSPQAEEAGRGGLGDQRGSADLAGASLSLEGCPGSAGKVKCTASSCPVPSLG